MASAPKPSSRPERRSQRRALFLLGVALAALGVAVFAGARSGGRAPALFGRATRVADVRGWRSSHGTNPNQGDYRWLSSDVLLLRPGPLPRTWELVGRDLRTGAQKRVEEDWYHAVLSPDGKWVLRQTWTHAGRVSGPQLVASALDDPARANVLLEQQPITASRGPEAVFWLPDSSGVVQISWGPVQGRATVYPLRGSGSRPRARPILFLARQPQPARFVGLNNQPLLHGMTPAGSVVAVEPGAVLPAAGPPRGPAGLFGAGVPPPRNLSVSMDGDNLNNSWGASIGGSALDVLEWQVLTPNVPPRRRPITLPPGVTEAELVLSPRGDRWAWLGTAAYLPPFQTWLQRWFPRLSFTPERSAVLWTTALDGGDARLIGRSPLAPNAAPPRSARWTPNSERISFVYNNALWTVPAR